MPTIVVTIWGYVLAAFQIPASYLGPIATWTAAMLEAERKSIIAAIGAPTVWLAMGTAAFFAFSTGIEVGSSGKSRLRAEIASTGAALKARNERIAVLVGEIDHLKHQALPLALVSPPPEPKSEPVAAKPKRRAVRHVQVKSAAGGASAASSWPF